MAEKKHWFSPPADGGLRSRPARRILTAVAAVLNRLPDLHGQRILLGLSGGSDSVALFHALRLLGPQLGFELTAAHLNHGLRGVESERDADFVRALCAGFKVHLRMAATTALSAGAGNLEERARLARRRFLEDAAQAVGADFIALGHQADDQAETILMRLLRGSGLRGLSAMAEVGPGPLLRPLLSLTRVEIKAFLSAIDAPFVDDSSNASLAPDRNRVRHLLLPLLAREFSPAAATHLRALANELRRVDHFLQGLARRALDQCRPAPGMLDLARLRELDSALAAVVMRTWMAEGVGTARGLLRSHVDALLKLGSSGAPNGQLDLPRGWRARRQYGTLFLERHGESQRNAAAFEFPVASQGMTPVFPALTVFKARQVPAAGAGLAAIKPADQFEAMFDADLTAAGLAVRSFQPGDRIAPLGLGGTRKVKDVFIQYKIAPGRRASYPIVTLGTTVVWLPGLVRSRWALVGAETRRILLLRAKTQIA